MTMIDIRILILCSIIDLLFGKVKLIIKSLKKNNTW